jgi:hypothetical protein
MLKLTRVIFSRSIERWCNDCVGGINYVLHVFISYVYCVDLTCHFENAYPSYNDLENMTLVNSHIVVDFTEGYQWRQILLYNC